MKARLGRLLVQGPCASFPSFKGDFTWGTTSESKWGGALAAQHGVKLAAGLEMQTLEVGVTILIDLQTIAGGYLDNVPSAS